MRPARSTLPFRAPPLTARPWFHLPHGSGGHARTHLTDPRSARTLPGAKTRRTRAPGRFTSRYSSAASVASGVRPRVVTSPRSRMRCVSSRVVRGVSALITLSAASRNVVIV
jgi:hypothetical protein